MRPPSCISGTWKMERQRGSRGRSWNASRISRNETGSKISDDKASPILHENTNCHSLCKVWNWCTGWPFRLFQTSRWHQNKSSVLVWSPCTKTQPLLWSQREFWNNLNGHPVRSLGSKLNDVENPYFSYTEDNFKGGLCLLSGDAPSNVTTVESDKFSLHMRLARCPLQARVE